MPQTQVPLTYLDDDVGSVICLCMRACLIRCSFSAFWTSAGISGEVWLIFNAASSTFVVGFPFSLTSLFLNGLKNLRRSTGVALRDITGIGSERFASPAGPTQLPKDKKRDYQQGEPTEADDYC